jgi:metal-dependent amidase/aminoacylase/carboxypeptidase family protein
VGTTAKRVTFTGRAAHAAAYPWEGANALKAATLAMTAMDFQRETFRDEDSVRVHWIVSKGGEIVNAVPADVHLDITVRARTVPAMVDAAAKVDRALHAGAMAMGCSVTIDNVAGMMPLKNDPNMSALVHDNLVALYGLNDVGGPSLSGAATDVGDLGLIMPVVQPMITGVLGTPHTNTYQVTDHLRAAVEPAKFMAMTVIDLLAGDAATARNVLAQAHDRLISRAELIALRRSLDRRSTWPPTDISGQ